MGNVVQTKRIIIFICKKKLKGELIEMENDLGFRFIENISGRYTLYEIPLSCNDEMNSIAIIDGHTKRFSNYQLAKLFCSSLEMFNLLYEIEDFLKYHREDKKCIFCGKETIHSEDCMYHRIANIRNIIKQPKSYSEMDSNGKLNF